VEIACKQLRASELRLAALTFEIEGACNQLPEYQLPVNLFAPQKTDELI